MFIQLVISNFKVISSEFRFIVRGKVMVSNEQDKTAKSVNVNQYTFIAKFLILCAFMVANSEA
jgi:hypothetical protein